MKSLKQQAEEARAALRQRSGQFGQIAQVAGLHPTWIGKYAAGEIESPGVMSIDKLNVGLRAVPKARALRKTRK